MPTRHHGPMKPRKTTYLLHRWVGLIVCVQLLAWSTGGLLFAVLDIDTVHGDDDSRLTAPAPIPTGQVRITPDLAIERAATAGADIGDIVQVILRTSFEGSPEYLLLNPGNAAIARVNATDGAASLLLSETEAVERARADFIHESPIVSVRLIESEIPSEARGRRAPLYRIEFDHPHGTRLYLDAVSGDIVARRNNSWRLFDWFWMLHIMDYDERDDFNHPLLIIFAAMAVATSASGIGLWGWRTVPRIRKRWAKIKKPA